MNQPQTIAGFSDGILGAELNKERAVQVRFPADYARKEWANKEAIFQVTVKENQGKEAAEPRRRIRQGPGARLAGGSLNRKFVKNLQKEQESRSEKEWKNRSTNRFVDNHKFSIPPTTRG